MSKKTLFTLLAAILSCLLMEAGSDGLYFLMRGRVPSQSQFKSRILQTARHSEDVPKFDPEAGSMQWKGFFEVVHPYLGFVMDPQRMKEVSDYGFFGKASPMASRLNDAAVVGVFGGSVAREMGAVTGDFLAQKLKTLCPAYRNRRIVILNLGLGGYKQPQQLMTLAYFLALGAHFDAVINLDGFNDIVLTGNENFQNHVFPFFPRDWALRVNNLPTPDLLAGIGRLYLWDQGRKYWAALFAAGRLYNSNALGCLWNLGDKYFSQKHLLWAAVIEGTRQSGKSGYMVTGPAYGGTDETVLKDSAAVWERCSFEMNALCQAHGIYYGHFLQPNQYDEGSKIMGDRERKTAFRPDHPYRPWALHGYPYLRKQGKQLAKEGVHFHDLSMIFSRNDEPLYSDDCCHLNPTGMDLIASAIAQAIRNDMSTPPSH